MIKLVTRSIKNSRDQKWRYFPAISYSGTITRDKLCERISESTTFTHADVLTALCAFEEAIAEKLRRYGKARLTWYIPHDIAFKRWRGKQRRRKREEHSLTPRRFPPLKHAQQATARASTVRNVVKNALCDALPTSR